MNAIGTVLITTVLFFSLNSNLNSQALQQSDTSRTEEALLGGMHSITSSALLGYVERLASPQFSGRLTGTPGYDSAAQWTADLFKRWNIRPAGDNGTYFQNFANPYTLVLDKGAVVLHIPAGKNDTIDKSYTYEDEYYPGATSDAGTVTAEVVYVGYGITAPELQYDDYAAVDVKGKLVMMEPEIPVSPDKGPATFLKWRPYSFHDYKMRNAFAHGAAGVVYNYHIVNPNCVFIKGLVIAYVGAHVIDDVFAGTGKKREDVVQRIRTDRKPASMRTGKLMTIRCTTQYHPEGMGKNVVGIIDGSDPILKNEVIMIGAHLDHVGMNPFLMPGANDNASGSSVLLGTAEALSRNAALLKRSVLFILFGAEEQGVRGSEFYLTHPLVPNERVKAFINLESIGRGEKLVIGAGKNYPKISTVFEQNDLKYIHRPISADTTANLGRPRQDAAHFLWANIPTIGIGCYGAKPVTVPTYHTTHDIPEYITPEILEDIARLTYLSVVDLAR